MPNQNQYHFQFYQSQLLCKKGIIENICQNCMYMRNSWRFHSFIHFYSEFYAQCEFPFNNCMPDGHERSFFTARNEILILIDQKLRHTKISANFQVNIYLITLAKHYHNNSRWRYIKTTTKIGKSQFTQTFMPISLTINDSC